MVGTSQNETKDKVIGERLYGLITVPRGVHPRRLRSGRHSASTHVYSVRHTCLTHRRFYSGQTSVHPVHTRTALAHSASGLRTGESGYIIMNKVGIYAMYTHDLTAHKTHTAISVHFQLYYPLL